MNRSGRNARRIAFALVLVLASAIICAGRQQTSPSTTPHPVRIVMHGGAGTILKENMTPETERQYRAKLTEALMAGYDILKKHGTSLDAVEATIRILEDSPLFNAGKGAVFTHEGTNELDAAIMDGKTKKAGAVAGVRHIKNPISLARLVMEKSPHVMLVGAGAEAFAKENGIPLVPAKYFYTDRRWPELLKAQEKEKKLKRESIPDRGIDTSEGKHGTVGCVALDERGDLAAGTSTGGLTNKRFGRVGDSPIIGAGTYADNQSCAVSATGTGEYFMRSVAAFDIAALMRYGGVGVQEAARRVVMDEITQMGGDGGVIALDRDGNFAMPFNTPGMYRGYVKDDGTPVIQMYKE